MSRHGKRYREAAEKIEQGRRYQPAGAVSKIKETASTRFDETVELHLRTGADPRHADQQVRGVAPLPHGSGKPVRITVFAQGEGMTNAREAGADYIGDDDLIKKIQTEGWSDFDVSIATPDMMGKVSRLGKVLGRKGLMPNPKTGTVVPAEDIGRAVNEARQGRVEFRLDRTSIMHVPIGKASFQEDQLLENMTSVMDQVMRARPAGIKGQFIRSAHLATSMGPSVPVDVAALSELKLD